MLTNDNYFDSGRDRAVVEAGGFFCQACLIGKPADDASPDERYCQGCHDFLLNEIGHSNAGWYPKVEATGSAHSAPEQHPAKQESVTKLPEVKDIGQGRNEFAKTPSVGRPSVDLPLDRVMEMASQGLSYRTIAERLRDDGVDVSHMAVGRAIKKMQGILL